MVGRAHSEGQAPRSKSSSCGRARRDDAGDPPAGSLRRSNAVFDEMRLSSLPLLVVASIRLRAGEDRPLKGHETINEAHMTTLVTDATLSEADHTSQLRKAIIASTIGTAIE